MNINDLLAEVSLMIEETQGDKKNFIQQLGFGDQEALNYYDHRLEALNAIAEELFRLQDLEK